MAIDAPPRPARHQEHARPSLSPSRFRLAALGQWLLAAGALATLAGAALDAQHHLSDPNLAHHEAVVSFSNPAHGLLVLHTDGLTSHWTLDQYPGVMARHPSLVAGVLYRDFKRGHDDVAVVVASGVAR